MPSLAEVWRKAQPWQRRNIVLAGVLMAWGAALVVDMQQLKQKAEVRKKFGLDDEAPKEKEQDW